MPDPIVCPAAEIGNAPSFDPLFPTPKEMADMLDGYRAAGGSGLKPAITSVAFDHGWRMRRNDKAGVVDDDQREQARRFLNTPEAQPSGRMASEESEP